MEIREKFRVEIRRKRTGKAKGLSGNRMKEGKLPGMQRLSCIIRIIRTIEIIPRKGMPDGL